MTTATVGPAKITLASELDIASDVDIDATTQTGFNPTTGASGVELTVAVLSPNVDVEALTPTLHVPRGGRSLNRARFAFPAPAVEALTTDTVAFTAVFLRDRTRQSKSSRRACAPGAPSTVPRRSPVQG